MEITDSIPAYITVPSISSSSYDSIPVLYTTIGSKCLALFDAADELTIIPLEYNESVIFSAEIATLFAWARNGEEVSRPRIGKYIKLTKVE